MRPVYRSGGVNVKSTLYTGIAADVSPRPGCFHLLGHARTSDVCSMGCEARDTCGLNVLRRLAVFVYLSTSFWSGGLDQQIKLF